MSKQKLFIFASTGVVVSIGLLAVCLQYSPEFTIQVLGIFTVAICYTLTEHWQTHAAIEFENRFWSFIAFLLARALVFCDDSPFCFSADHNRLGWIFVVMTAYSAHLYDRHLMRRVLIRPSNIPRNDSSMYDSVTRDHAREVLDELRVLIDVLDNPLVSSTFMNFFNLGSVLQAESQILEIFQPENTYKDELNLIVSADPPRIPLLFQKMKDHKLVQKFNRSKLLHILAFERLHELNVNSKAHLIDAFQKMKLSAHTKTVAPYKNASEYVKNIILNTKLDDLSNLKSLTDGKGDVYNLHKLIYTDIQSDIDRTAILDWFERQKNDQDALARGGGGRGRKRGLLAWKKILSDIDDTLTCSGGKHPNGEDTRYPGENQGIHLYYPGVFAFYRELDLGPTGDPIWDNRRSGNLAMLSARPHVYTDFTERNVYKKFTTLKNSGRIYTVPTILTGDLVSGSQFLMGGDLEPIAKRKFDNLKQYMELYPEYKCIIIGDNGQGDLRASEMVIDDAKLKTNLTRTYIHKVKPLEKSFTKHVDTKSESNENVCFFSNYVDAAIDAFQHNLIRLGGLRKIVQESLQDFYRISADDWDKAQRTLAPAVPKAAPNQASLHDIPKINPFYTPFVAHDTLKVEARARELNASIMRANKIYVYTISAYRRRYSEISFRDFMEELNGETTLIRYYMNRFPNGTVVQTCMGKGVVTSFRRVDMMYQVIIQWDSTGLKPPVRCFFQAASICLLPTLSISPRVKSTSGWGKLVPEPVSLRSTISMSRLPNDEVARKDVPSTVHSNLSSPSSKTQDSAGGQQFTMAALARHRVISGMADRNSTIPLNTILTECAFVPSVLERASVHHGTSTLSSVAGAVGNRARTVSSTSDDVISLSGRKKDPNDVLCNSRGAVCWTPYGLGVVKDYRRGDAAMGSDMITVTFPWGAEGHFARSTVVQLTNPSETLQRVSDLTEQRMASKADRSFVLSDVKSKSKSLFGAANDIPPDISSPLGKEAKEAASPDSDKTDKSARSAR